MHLHRVHSVSRTGKLTLLALLTALLAGCQGISGIQPVTEVRVIDASPDAPALDIHQNADVGLYNVAFGTVSSYVPLPAGSYTHSAYTAGTQQRLATVKGSFANGGQYTVLAGNIAADLHMTVLQDQSTPAPAGRISLRFLNQATRSGPVDIYLLPPGTPHAPVTPVVTAARFGSNTGYLDAPAGTYSLLVLPTGANPRATTPEYSGSQVAYPSGSVRTILLIDQPAQPDSARSLQIITAADFDPTVS